MTLDRFRNLILDTCYYYYYIISYYYLQVLHGRPAVEDAAEDPAIVVRLHQ